MRIAIDMQGALTDGSRIRGIGRYTQSLVSAMIKERGEHDIRLMLNANFPDACAVTMRELGSCLPARACSAYSTPTSGCFNAFDTSPSRRVADGIVRRHAAGIKPDAMLFTSIFEIAPLDFSPLNLARYPAKTCAAIVYDLIPAIFDDLYFGDPNVRKNFYAGMEVLKSADLLLAISDFTRRDAIAWLDVNPSNVINISAAADDTFRQLDLSVTDRTRVLRQAGLSRPFVMCVSGSDPRKNLKGAIEAFAALSPDVRSRHQILLVTSVTEEHAAAIHRRAEELGIEPDGVVLLEGVSDDALVCLFNACEAFVFPSLYEGFGLPVLEALQCGAPVLAGNNSSLPEIVNRNDILFDAGRSESAAPQLERILTEPAFRGELVQWGLRRAKQFTWERSARLALDALQAAAKKDDSVRRGVMLCELLNIDGARAEIVESLAAEPDNEHQIESFVDALTRSVPAFQPSGSRRLLIDVTDTLQSGRWTGIQRVVRELTKAFYKRGVEDSIVPVAVHLDDEGPWSMYDFPAIAIGRTCHTASYPIEARDRDDLFMLDSNWIRYESYSGVFSKIRRRGGRIFTCVYDLIPELHPQVCLEGVPAVHERWLRAAVMASDGILCISQAVADELLGYINQLRLPYRSGLKIGWFHCGSDILDDQPIPLPHESTRSAFDVARPTFLMVGTLEPRKNHVLALDGFERLWRQGVDATLCIIGRQGWNNKPLEQRILSHNEFNHRLFWLADADDSDLVYAYRHSAAALCPSIAEGFGLPIVEAARMKLPVICSDIPVFREIAAQHATYFALNDSEGFAKVLQNWMSSYPRTDPDLINGCSWVDSVQRIRQILYGNEWYAVLE